MAACVLGLLAGTLSPAVRSQADQPAPLEDPMRPSGLPAPAEAGTPGKAPPAELRLQAIKREGRHHLAVINGQIVRVGDEVDGIKITAISAGSVMINVEGKSSVLKLLGQDIKHDARKTH